MNNIQASGRLRQLDEDLLVNRAVMADFLQQYWSYSEGLQNWNRATSGAFKLLLTSNDYGQFALAIKELRQADPMRPTSIPDLMMIPQMNDKIGRLVERIHKIDGLCTRLEYELL